MSTARPEKVVIVGAGHGGGTVAATLRRQGFEGEVLLVGDEPTVPYHRPPLSKQLLKGKFVQLLQPETFYANNRIELRTHTCVVSIDRDQQAVTLENGESLSYDALVIATGARARALEIPGVELAKVHELRTLAHAEVLAEVLAPSTHLAIIGGGWIGLEVAASARRHGVQTTVIEREPRLLARVASQELSTYLTEYHRGQGVTIVTGADVQALAAGDDGAVGAVVLADGREIAADSVLIGVGALPNDELARACGLKCDGGVLVDYGARTSDERIFAIGDVTRRPLMLRDDLVRLESIPSTIEQARQVAAAIVGQPAPEPEAPWFWSDQYELKLQIAGLIGDGDRITLRTDPERDKLAVFHTRGGRMVALEGINAGSEFVSARQLIRDQTLLDLDKLADATVPLDQVALLEPVVEDAPAEAGVPEAAAGAPEVEEEAPPGPGGKPGLPRATFVERDGSMRAVEIPVGSSLMEGSVSNNLPGIIAECGGMCSCGTCHVYVDDPWAGMLPEAEYEEADLLEFIEHRQDNSRLSCQLVMTDELDGIVVRVAQYS